LKIRNGKKDSYDNKEENNVSKDPSNIHPRIFLHSIISSAVSEGLSRDDIGYFSLHGIKG
jgi:hypothetical protein